MRHLLHSKPLFPFTLGAQFGLLAGTTLVAVAWLTLSGAMAVGYVRAAHAVPGGGGALLEVALPLPGSATKYVTTREAPSSLEGRWIAAIGDDETVAGAPVLVARAAPALPVLGEPALAGGVGMLRALLDAVLLQSDLALIVAFSLLLTGFLPVRLLGAALLGAVAGAVVWHAAILGGYAGWFGAGADVAKTAFFGAALLGALLGLRRDGLLPQLAQRAVLALILLLLAQELASTFGWPLLLAQALAVLVPAISRPAGLVLLVGFLGAHGLGATVPAAHVVLFVAAMLVHFLIGGRWFRPLRRTIARPAFGGHRLSLQHLFSA